MKDQAELRRSARLLLVGIGAVCIVIGVIMFAVATADFNDATGIFRTPSLGTLSEIEGRRSLGVGLAGFGALAVLLFLHALALTPDEQSGERAEAD